MKRNTVKDKPISLKDVVKSGRRDGKGWRWKVWPFTKHEESIMPASHENKDFTPYENGLIKACQHDMTLIERAWEQEDNKLLKAYCQTFREFNQTKEKLQKEEAEVTEPAQKFAEAAKQLEEVDIAPVMNERVSMPLVILMGFLEFPLNNIVFQVFGESKTMTMILSLTLAIVIPLGAHFLGLLLKQKEKRANEWVFIFLIPVIFFIVLWGASLVRARVMQSTQSLMPSDSRLSQDESLWVFYIINLLLFTIAVVISYLGSRENIKEFKTKRKNCKTAKLSLEKESKEAVVARERFNKAEIEFSKRKIDREKAYQEFKARASTKIEDSKFSIEKYREANANARRMYNHPQCTWAEIPELTIPEKLMSISWDCSHITIKEA